MRSGAGINQALSVTIQKKEKASYSVYKIKAWNDLKHLLALHRSPFNSQIDQLLTACFLLRIRILVIPIYRPYRTDTYLTQIGLSSIKNEKENRRPQLFISETSTYSTMGKGIVVSITQIASHLHVIKNPALKTRRIRDEVRSHDSTNERGSIEGRSALLI